MGNTPTGWLGRYLDVALAQDDNPLKAVALGTMVPQTLVSERSPVLSIQSVNGFRFLVGRADALPVLTASRRMPIRGPRICKR